MSIALFDTISNLNYSFDWAEVGSSDIIHLASGVIASSEVAKNLLTAEEGGDEPFVKYCKERLQKDDKLIQDTLP